MPAMRASDDIPTGRWRSGASRSAERCVWIALWLLDPPATRVLDDRAASDSLGGRCA